MIGLRNAVATVVKMTRPIWAPTDEDMMEIFVSPGLVQWDYVPLHHPWRIFRGQCGEGILFEAFQTDDAGAMFWRFVRDNLPRDEQWCMVLDGDGKCVFGWVSPDGTQTIWSGCAWAFQMLEIIHEPVDVALWEQNARANIQLERTLRGSTRA